MQKNLFVIISVIIAIGIALAGWFVGSNYYNAKMSNRVVVVKGTAEQEVVADSVVWNLRSVYNGNDLADVLQRVEHGKSFISSFLKKHGIEDSEIELQGIDVRDRHAQEYSGNNQNASRFIVYQTLTVRTQKLDNISNATQSVNELVNAGIILVDDTGTGTGPLYLYTKLNDIKPAMIAEATKNAKAAAEQFAKDSGSKVGGIKNANQGLFQISGVGQISWQPEERSKKKIVRVVTTIEYYLEY